MDEYIVKMVPLDEYSIQSALNMAAASGYVYVDMKVVGVYAVLITRRLPTEESERS